MSVPNLSDYAHCDAWLGKRPARTVPSIRATRVERMLPGVIVIRYHGSAVVHHYAVGGSKLSSCGYRTNTTKERINQFSHARVYQRNWEWYMHDGTPFVDGVVVHS